MQVETYQLFARFLATAFFLAGAFLVTFLRAGEVFFGGAFFAEAFFVRGAFLAFSTFGLDSGFFTRVKASLGKISYGLIKDTSSGWAFWLIFFRNIKSAIKI